MAIHLSLVSCLSSSSPPYSSCIQPNTPHSSFSLPLSLASLLDRSFHAALLMISLPRASLRLDRELLVALLLPRHPRHSLLPTRRHDSSTLHSLLSHTPRPRVNQRRFALRGRWLRLRQRQRWHSVFLSYPSVYVIPTLRPWCAGAGCSFPM